GARGRAGGGPGGAGRWGWCPPPPRWGWSSWGRWSSRFTWCQPSPASWPWGSGRNGGHGVGQRPLSRVAAASERPVGRERQRNPGDWMVVASAGGASDGVGHPFGGSCDQTSTIRSATTMAMTGLPLSCPSVRPLTTVERVDAGGPYRLRGRPIVAL